MSSITNDIDAIIARAMSEYAARHPEGVEEVAIPANIPESIEPWDATQTESTPNIIEENSGSLLVDERTSRFSSAVWYGEIQKQTVLLAGLGGIGSYVAFLLSRLNIDRLYLFDPDTVEAGNMSGQLYDNNSIGITKASALCTILNIFSNYYSSSVYSTAYNPSYTSKVMICGFDNMEARKLFYRAWKACCMEAPEEERKTYLFIDGRLAAESFQVLCIRGDDNYNMEKYEREFLFSDAEADETICSYKQTTFMANMIGSIITNLFVNFVANTFCEVLVPRDLPFLTEYSADTMYFKVTT